jgi:hypothetical protein
VNTVEILLVLVGIPLAVIVVLALLTLRGGRRRTRYKPGQPWNHAPVWYEPHPEHPVESGGHGETKAIGSSMYGEQPEERNTGGSGNGSTTHGSTTHGSTTHGSTTHGSTTHGATAVGATAVGAAAPRAVDAGPLGGARGTW